MSDFIEPTAHDILRMNPSRRGDRHLQEQAARERETARTEREFWRRDNEQASRGMRDAMGEDYPGEHSGVGEWGP